MSRKQRFRGIQELRPGVFLIRIQRMNPKTGRPQDVRRRVACAGFAEAIAEQERMLSELQRGGRPADRLRLKDYASSWLLGRLPTLKPSTRARYADTLDRHILPQLGDFFLDSLSPEDVLRWFSEKAKMHAASTANGYLNLLKTLLADAVAQLDLPRDPTRRIRAVPDRRLVDSDAPVNLLTADEVKRFLEALRTRWPQWHALVFTQFATARRFGEVTALRWEDVDFDRKLIKIRRAQWRTVVSTPKTDRIVTVPMTLELERVLVQWRKQLATHRHAKAGWLFPSEVGKPHQNASCMTKAFVDCLSEIGVKRRFSSHGLRRTMNDLLRRVATGQVTRAITGHVTEQMTEHYSHVDQEEKRTAVRRALRLIEGGKTGRSRRQST